jgi:hypothetical protein
MVGRQFAQRDAQKFSQAEAVGTPPGDAPLRAEALEVAHQQHPEVDARRNAGPPQGVVIVRLAQPFDELVEACFSQQLVELAVKHMPFRPRQLVHCDPEGWLLLMTAASQGHR